MQYTTLGKTDVKISRICLGTMTWGEQNSETDAHMQMDYALERGVNFWDTAEMYAVPPSERTFGKTEEYIGSWFKKSGKRDKVVLATKVAGPGIPWIRGGKNKIDGGNIRAAIEGSLRRLQTEYVDLYQLHWPNRPFPHFQNARAGKIDFTTTTTQKEEDNFLDVLHTLDNLVGQGKIRHIGLSDDSAWGISKYIALSEKHGLPRVASIQNEFSLLCRRDDPYVAETCVREGLSYLPWSPLATGMISGKYAGGKTPEGTRWHIEKTVGQSGSWRGNPISHAAVQAYCEVAEKHGLDVCQMALKFCDMQNFVASTIIGATTMEQLKNNIDAFDITLSNDVLKDIDGVYRQYPIPF